VELFVYCPVLKGSAAQINSLCRKRGDLPNVTIHVNLGSIESFGGTNDRQVLQNKTEVAGWSLNVNV
jgi:hypothetical protein